MRTWTALLAGLLVPMLALGGPVDINTADAVTLAKELQGVGMSRAQAIIDYRERNGGFKSVDEILKVKGIGPQVLEQNRGNMQVREPKK